MKRNVVKIVNQMLIGRGASNSYKIKLCNILNINKDYERSSVKARIFS